MTDLDILFLYSKVSCYGLYNGPFTRNVYVSVNVKI